jgi:hypothetical protein
MSISRRLLFIVLLPITVLVVCTVRDARLDMTSTNITRVVGDTAPLLTMHRGLCPDFSHCPAYSVSLYRDGLVRYEGVIHVIDVGTRERRVDPRTIRQLHDRVLRSGLHRKGSRYGSENCYQVTDQEVIFLQVLVGGTVVYRVEHYLGCSFAPSSFRFAEQEIDRVAGTLDWVGTDPYVDEANAESVSVAGIDSVAAFPYDSDARALLTLLPEDADSVAYENRVNAMRSLARSPRVSLILRMRLAGEADSLESLLSFDNLLLGDTGAESLLNPPLTTFDSIKSTATVIRELLEPGIVPFSLRKRLQRRVDSLDAMCRGTRLSRAAAVKCR